MKYFFTELCAILNLQGCKVDINWDNFSSEKLSVHQGYIDGIRRI
jgi:hypothetical protein